MAVKWVDFKKLKESLDFGKVLEHYGVKLQVKGDQLTGFCPLPTHNGERNSPSFSANVKRRMWQCFGCGAKGNVLDFAVRMEGKSPANRADVRAVALVLQERFATTSEPPTQKLFDRKSKPAKQATQSNGVSAQPTVINQPLDFELKGLNVCHRYLWDRGFHPDTIKHFGLGYCSRGLYAGRAVIPIHSPQGKLIGYAGRVVDDGTISEENPKYKFPPKREREGVMHEFRKSFVLYNAHRIIPPAPNLIVVEGFASVWWLYQHGFRDVCALMGWSCSTEQAAIILSKVPPDGRVLVFPDGDDGGKRCAHSVFDGVGAERCVQWVRLQTAKQPTDCTGAELSKLLSDA